MAEYTVSFLWTVDSIKTYNIGYLDEEGEEEIYCVQKYYHYYIDEKEYKQFQLLSKNIKILNEDFILAITPGILTKKIKINGGYYYHKMSILGLKCTKKKTPKHFLGFIENKNNLIFPHQKSIHMREDPTKLKIYLNKMMLIKPLIIKMGFPNDIVKIIYNFLWIK